MQRESTPNKAKPKSETAQIKIGVRKSTREKYDAARAMTRMNLVELADAAIDCFIDRQKRQRRRAG